MTDNEIIERLHLSLRLGDSPIGNGFATIVDKKVVSETIVLIEAQKSEIERLQHENEKLKTAVFNEKQKCYNKIAKYEIQVKVIDR